MTEVTRRRALIWGGIGTVVVAALVVAVWPRAVPVDFAAVTRGPLVVTLDHEGKTRLLERYVVSAPVAGRVLRIELEPGDPVRAGETVLATFLPAEPVPLDARSRAQARARVKSARAAFDQARATREQLAAEARYAADQSARAERLAADELISAQDLESAKTSSSAAQEALNAAEAGVETARHELELASAALLEPTSDPNDARAALHILAPVDGVVLRRLQESEAVLAPGAPLLELGDPQQLEVIADYLSTDAVRMRPGMSVSIEQWGGAEPIRGAVKRVEPAGFLKVSALGVEEQRVWVVVEFEDPHAVWAALGDGYRVECRVAIWSGDDVVQVPNSALFRHGEGWAVFRVTGGHARLAAVKIGHRNGQSAEVLDGLAVGDKVVVHPPDAVGDGVRVAARTS